MTETTDTPKLPHRLLLAIAPGEAVRVGVLRETHRRAVESLEDDARLLHEAGVADGIMVMRGPGRILFRNGSRIDYAGGQRHNLEQWVRGRQFHYLDGGDLLPEGLAAIVVRP